MTGGGDRLIDVTKGDLLPNILRIAWPSILQAVLSNCYAFNDYVFVAHIPDADASAAATAALSATIGLQVISYAVQNCIPSGANTYSSQYRGSGDSVQQAATFRAAFYSCLVVSSVTSLVGTLCIDQIASLCNASPQVTASVVAYFGTLLFFSPAFTLLLLVDGCYKSCGDTITPLRLEIFSLCLNTLLNYIMVIVMNLGVRGAAMATVLSRFVPAFVGLVGILNGSLGIDVRLFPGDFRCSACKFMVDFFVIGAADSKSEKAIGVKSLVNAVSNTDSNSNGVLNTSMEYAKLPGEDYLPSEDLKSSDTVKGFEVEMVEIPAQNPEHSSDHHVESIQSANAIDFNSSVDVECGDLETPVARDCEEPWSRSLQRVLAMLKIGVSQSFSDSIYGVVFTIMIRLAGELGQSQQAAYGAAMRGVEWMAFCAGEGFLTASATAVGQCIGAGQFKRAMDAAILSALLSSVATGILGVPFIISPHTFAQIISPNEDIVHYTAQYLRIVGYVMATVGFEMACYGAMLGAGQAGKIVLINGSMNLCRIPLAVLCLYGSHRFPQAFIWAIGGNQGFSKTSEIGSGILNNNSTYAVPPAVEGSNLMIGQSSGLGPPSGTFLCICWVVAGTATMKAVVYSAWLGYRVVTKTYFSDSRVIDK